MENLRARTILAGLGILLTLIWIVPNFGNMADHWVSKRKLNYGLDIQGGLHLVMGVDVDGVIRESTGRIEATLKTELEKDGVSLAGVKSVKPEDGEFELDVSTPDLKDKVVKYIDEHYATTLQVMSAEGAAITVRYFDSYMTDYKSKVIQQAIETIRNRVDEFGVAEPSISQQGIDRILV